MAVGDGGNGGDGADVQGDGLGQTDQEGQDVQTDEPAGPDGGDAADDASADSAVTDTADAQEDQAASDAGFDLVECGEGTPTPGVISADYFNYRLNDPNTYSLVFDGPVALTASALTLTPENGGPGEADDIVVTSTESPEAYLLSVDAAAGWLNGDEYTLTVPPAAVAHLCGGAPLASAFDIEVNAVDCTANTPPSFLNDNEDMLLPGEQTYQVRFDERAFGVGSDSFTLTRTAGTGSGAIDSITPVDRRTYDLTLSGLADGDVYSLSVTDGPTDSCGEGVDGAPALITTLTVAEPVEGGGENCSAPITLSSGTSVYTFQASLVDHLTASLLYDAGCISAEVLSGPDIVLVYTTTLTGQLTITVSAQSDFGGGLFRMAAVLTDDACGSPVLDAGGSCDSSYSETPSATVSIPVVTGTAYYLYVAKTDSSPNTFLDNKITVTVSETE